MTIPASHFASVTPSVLPAGGSALELLGLALTPSTRVPTNGTDAPQVLSFATPAAVGSYFGLNSTEYAWAGVYFRGFNNSTKKPAAALFAQYNQNHVSAYLRGGNISGMPLATLQGLSGNISVIVDGYAFEATGVSLSAATSFSSAATILNGDLLFAGSASVTGSIAPTVDQTNGTLMVTAVGSGTVAVGQVVTGSGVAAGTQITGYITGTGGTGTYYVNNSQTVASEALTCTAPAASFTASISKTTMTVTAVGSGTLTKGMLISGTGVDVTTTIQKQLTGTAGSTGTYQVSVKQTVSSESMTGAVASPAVTYDSVSGAFVVTSGTKGASSTIAFATRSLAPLLLLDQADGAVTSQGADAADPVGFMSALALGTQNWFSFTTLFDPDATLGGNSIKLLFSQWVNSTNNRFAYVAVDSDVTPTTTVPATGSMGYILNLSNSSGTCLQWSGTYDLMKSAFVCGYWASLDFGATDGRTDLAYSSQEGLTADVTDLTTAANLEANGYNYYGVAATANDTFIFEYPGAVTGDFDWADTYGDQCWMNNSFQLDMMLLLTTAKSIPYNAAGRSLIRASLKDTINAALNFGAIRTGVALSSLQVAEVNASAGTPIDTVLTQQGWYLLVQDAAPEVRQARGSPPCTFWWTDGESVQSLNLASVTVQ